MNSTEELDYNVKESGAILSQIDQKGWWQGSLIPSEHLSTIIDLSGFPDVNYWIIASQTCNLYNPLLEAVPLFEVVGAKVIDTLSGNYSKGDHPRILHVVASSNDKQSSDIVNLHIEIQKRYWLPRTLLADLNAPLFSIQDSLPANVDKWEIKQYLDNFSAWMGRSYTRVTLPDSFNTALQKSKIDDVIKSKLVKQSDNIFGVYFDIQMEDDERENVHVSKMEPVFLLEIHVVVLDCIDEKTMSSMRESLIESLFSIKVDDPEDKAKKVTRSELALRYGIRVSKHSIEFKNMSSMSMFQLRNLVRYSVIDNLSNSSSAVPCA